MAKANTKSAVSNVLEFDTDKIKAREAEVALESDESIIERLRERFEILEQMTQAVKQGDVRAMIVSGPPESVSRLALKVFWKRQTCLTSWLKRSQSLKLLRVQ